MLTFKNFTLKSLIIVPVRLLFLRKKSTRYSLIRDCTIIKFQEFSTRYERCRACTIIKIYFFKQRPWYSKIDIGTAYKIAYVFVKLHHNECQHVLQSPFCFLPLFPEPTRLSARDARACVDLMFSSPSCHPVAFRCQFVGL